MHTSIESFDFRFLQRLYGPRFVLFGNFFFLIFTILIAVNCCTSKSLFYFFKNSTLFEAWNLFDSLKNFTLTAILLAYSMLLRVRILNLMKGYRLRGDNYPDPTQALIISKLANSVRKLIRVMLLCTICFVLRTTMLLIKCTYEYVNYIALASWLICITLLIAFFAYNVHLLCLCM